MAIQKKLISMGFFPVILIGTTLSILSSLLITFLILWLSGNAFLLITFIIASIAPAIITPIVIYFFIRLLFRIYTLEQKSREMATLDALTGILNRRAFFEHAEALLDLAEFGEQPISLLYLDLDKFKSINDRMGHQAGDKVITRFGSILDETRRKRDLAGRIGGEEFAVLLPETDLNGTKIFAEKIRNQVQSESVSVEGGTIKFTVSIGYVCREPNEPINLNEMIRQADTALYQAKRSGRNCSVGFKNQESITT